MGYRQTKGIRVPNILGVSAILVLLAVPVNGGKTQSGGSFVPDDHVAVILAPRHTAVLSAEVSARVVAINKELGQRFKEGETIVQFDETTYLATVDISQARFDSAKSHLAQIEKLIADKTRQRHADAMLAAATTNLKATEKLFSNGHVSQVDLANVKRDVTVAQTNRELVNWLSVKELTDARRELATARGELAIAEHALKACRLTGPYVGRVARVIVNEHELVKPGTPVAEIIDDRILRAKCLLPSAMFRSVRLGQKITIAVKETGTTVTATISHIAAVLDPASMTFDVYGEVDNSDGQLRAGMNGWLDIAEINRQGK